MAQERSESGNPPETTSCSHLRESESPTSEDAFQNRVADLGDAALDIDPGVNRDAYIESECGDDQVLKESVLRYITPAAELENLLDAPLVPPQPQPHSRIGRTVGIWRLVRVLGEGTFGIVYLCERNDGQVRQLGAIKFLKGTFRSRDVEIRFLDERQTLANLKHPYIVGMIDAGITEDGQPYLVMDYVEGAKPIDAYSKQKQLSVKQKLTLIGQVCEAVSYANRNLVVHRDLKPSNVLIAQDGTPRLVDFGLAKLLNPMHRASDEALNSHLVRMGSERYMSPEQTRSEATDISTDVFSLGTILFELIAGTDPYDLTGRQTEQSLPEIICKVDPESLSYVLKHRPGEGASQDYRHLSGSFRRDLDLILKVALRKEPQRRYSSAEVFRRDLERLSSHEPLEAHEDTLMYRSGRFLRRHRTGVLVGTAILVLIMIVIGFAATTLSNNRHRRHDLLLARLKARANSAAETQPELALLIRLELHRLGDLSEADTLLGAIDNVPSVPVTLTTGHSIDCLAYSSDLMSFVAVSSSTLTYYSLSEHSAPVTRPSQLHLDQSSDQGCFFSPNGRYLVTLGNRAVLWDVVDNKMSAIIDNDLTLDYSPKGGYLVSFSADNTRVAFAFEYSTQIYECKSGRLLSTLSELPKGEREHEYNFDYIQWISLSNAGDYFHTFRDLGNDKAVFSLWRVADGVRLATRPYSFDAFGDDYILSDGVAAFGDRLSFVKDGTPERIFLSGAGGTVKELSRLPANRRGPPTFSHSGRRLALKGETVITLWDTQTRKELYALPVLPEPDAAEHNTELTFSPDDRYLAIASERGNCVVIEAEEHSELFRFKCPEATLGLVFSDDGRYLAVGSSREDGRLDFYDLTFTSRAHSTIMYPDRITAAAYSPEMNAVVSVDRGNNVTAKAVNDGVTLWSGAFSAITSPDTATVKISPDGRFFVVSVGDVHEMNESNSLALGSFGSESGKPALSVIGDAVPAGEWSETVRISPNSRLIAFRGGGPSKKGLNLVPVSRNREDGIKMGGAWDIGRVLDFDFADSGESLVAVTDKGSWRWEHLRSSAPPASPIWLWPKPLVLPKARLSAGARYVILQNFEHCAMFEVATGESLFSDVPCSNPQAFDSSGTLFSLGSQMFRLPSTGPVPLPRFAPAWFVPSEHPINDIEGQLLGFSRDGRHSVHLLGNQVQSRLWQSDFVEADACARLSSNFSQEDWARLFEGEEYHKTCKSLPVGAKQFLTDKQ